MDAFAFLEGNLTREPEITRFQNGGSVTRIGVAVNRSWIDTTTGQRQKRTSFFDVEVWGKQGEMVLDTFHKGDRVCVTGYPEQQTWTDQKTDLPRQKVIFIGQSVAASCRFSTVSVPERSPATEPVASNGAPIAEDTSGEEPY